MAKDESATWKAVQRDKVVDVLKEAPSLHEVLAHPERYEAWLKKAQEALG